MGVPHLFVAAGFCSFAPMGQLVLHRALVLRPRVLARAYDHTRRYCTGQEARLVNGDLLLWTQALFGNSDFQK